MNRKVALYARVSTADQASGLEAQMRTLKEFCERNNIQEYEFFTDENQSGAKVSRPSLDRMMIAVRNGEIAKVVVYESWDDLPKYRNRRQSFEWLCFGRTSRNETRRRGGTPASIGRNRETNS
jgi:DNA invertase Pin-like site-specific DNA recombinase